MSTFSWLHLTDLHMGMAAHRPLLPAIKDSFLEDLKPLSDRSGSWDLVIFTGDLTQRGADEEFHKLDEFLAELWGRLKELGSEPRLVAVPGITTSCARTPRIRRS
jgi:3',5'-cyclic AMP phosphodiesterase CpdA